MSIVMILLLTVICMILHECGHALAAQALGLQFKVGLVRKPVRLVIGVLYPGEIVRWQDLLISAAGPAMSFAVAVVGFEISFTAGLISLLIGLTALIPFRGSDGWRMLKALS